MLLWEETVVVNIKQDATSPTVSLETIIVTYVTDSYEGIDMDTIDIPGQYLHAESYEDLI